MNEENSIVQQVLDAQADAGAADALIAQYLPFIKSEAAKLTGRVSREGYDDALSIAMLAFYEAMMAYDRGRGSFLKLAAVSIRNRLIDHARKEKRHAGIVPLDAPLAGSTDNRTLLDEVGGADNAMEERHERAAARTEIQEFAAQLAAFGLSLSEVADNCPRQERTLRACMKALAHAKAHAALLRQMVASRRLPLAQLAQGAGVERKTLERHRKYLIAILLAYTNGFEIIRGHLGQITRKEG